MKLRIKPLPDKLSTLTDKGEVKFIRSLMQGLLNHPQVEVKQTKVSDSVIVSFSNNGPILDMLPTNTIWTHFARQLYPGEKGVREVWLMGRSLYGEYDYLEYGFVHSGYEYIYKFDANDQVRLVTHWSSGRNHKKDTDINTFSITITPSGPISQACFSVEIDPKWQN